MQNDELLHASLCAAVGAVGVIALIVAALRRQVTNDQPGWDDSADEDNDHSTSGESRLSPGVLLAGMIGLIALTALASIVTVLLAARS